MANYYQIMRVDIKGFIIPHNKEPYYTCADRFAVNEESLSFAIADGVGGSLYPSYLSERITQDFVKDPRNLFDKENASLLIDYSSAFDRYYQKRYNELPLVKQQILDLKSEQTKASSCTFVGCYFDNDCWRYISIGDSYLFFLPKEGDLTKISSMDGKEFDVFPEYLSTSGHHHGKPIFGNLPLSDGTMLLMTDALSDWFISCYEKDKNTLDRVLSINNHTDFKSFCDEELASGRLHDDDCAMLRIIVTDSHIPGASFSISHFDSIFDLSISDLQDKVNSSHSLVGTLKGENNALHSDVDKLKRENEKLILQIEELNQELNKAREDLKIRLLGSETGEGSTHSSPVSIDSLILAIEDNIKGLLIRIQEIDSKIGQCSEEVKEVQHTSLDNILNKIEESIREVKDRISNILGERQDTKKKISRLLPWMDNYLSIVLFTIIIILQIVLLLCVNKTV